MGFIFILYFPVKLAPALLKPITTRRLPKITGGRVGGFVTRRVLPRAVQQLEMVPRADTKSQFWHPRVDTIPHFNSPGADK